MSNAIMAKSAVRGPSTSKRPLSAGRPAKLSFIPDILEQHVEELGFLWGQRQSALRSADYGFGAFLELEARISAHVHGIRVVGERGLAWIEPGLAADDPLEAFASGFALTHLRSATLLERAVDAFESADGPRRDGLRHALRHGPAACALDRLELLARHGAAPLAAAAAEVCAFHGRADLPADRLHAFLLSDDALVRAAGWRLVAYRIAHVEPRVYAAGVDDEDPAVRRAAMHAAAWCGQAGLLPWLRTLAQSPSADTLDALHLLAVLGNADDALLLDRIAGERMVGPAGFELLGALGDPRAIGTILKALEDEDPAIAAAAGRAFARMTGVDVTSGRTATIRSAGGVADEIDAEFQEDVALPDAEHAYALWRSRGALASATRIAQGFDLGRQLTRDTFGALDMASRWDVCLRGRFHGAWSGSPLWLETFPQPR
jgi:uncharacterized protein (TIGR02270 family)